MQRIYISSINILLKQLKTHGVVLSERTKPTRIVPLIELGTSIHSWFNARQSGHQFEYPALIYISKKPINIQASKDDKRATHSLPHGLYTGYPPPPPVAITSPLPWFNARQKSGHPFEYPALIYILKKTHSLPPQGYPQATHLLSLNQNSI